MAKRIELTHSPDTSVVDLMADVDVTLKLVEGQKEVELVDFLNHSVFKHCVDKVVFVAGKYNIRMLIVITEENDDNGTTKS